MSEAVSSPSPPRKKAALTRLRIIEAAIDVFSQRPYDVARLSDVADVAGINPALIVRYFGSKDRLYGEALHTLLVEQRAARQAGATLSGESILIGLEGGKGGARNPLPMVFNAGWDPTARKIARSLLESDILKPLGDALGPDGYAKAAEILALCAGVFVYRHLLPIKPFVGVIEPQTRSWFIRTVQTIIDRPADLQREEGL